MLECWYTVRELRIIYKWTGHDEGFCLMGETSSKSHLADSIIENIVLCWGARKLAGCALNSVRFSRDMISLRHFLWCQKTWNPLIKNLCHAKFLVQKILSFLTGLLIVLAIRFIVLHHHVVNTTNVSIGGGSCRTTRQWIIVKTLLPTS